MRHCKYVGANTVCISMTKCQLVYKLYLDDNKARSLYTLLYICSILVVDALGLRVRDLILTLKKNMFNIYFTPDTVQR